MFTSEVRLSMHDLLDCATAQSFHITAFILHTDVVLGDRDLVFL